jgi:type IV secretion system protein VirB6
MGFFGEFNAWLNEVLLAYIGNNTVRVAGVLEPAVVTLGTIYVMVWGYMHLTGQITEPLMTGVKKIAALAIIFGAALQLWLYNTLIVDTFFNAPAALAAAIIGAQDPVATIDEIINFGAQTAELLLRKGSIFDGNFAYYLAGIVVYAIVGLTAIYTIFLFALSRIALSVLLALGPLFISLLLFDTSKRFFEAWLAQLTNYAFISILTVLVAALMMAVVGDAARQAVGTGGEITVAHAARVCMAAGLTFLVMRQVMPMAAGLASGLALSTFGVVSSSLAWAFGGALRSTGQFARGLTDRETTRWDSYRRKAGYYVGRSVRQLASRRWTENKIRA